MKKVLTLSLALVLLLTMSISAFAAPGGFISSPSGNAAPQLISFSNVNKGCTAILKITSYADRESLTVNEKNEFENAYTSIANTSNVSSLNSELANISSGLNIPTDSLAVSDLFYMNYDNCDSHNEHGAFTIEISAETLKKFVSLMRYDGSKWVLVDDAKVSEDGLHLIFSSEELGPFAIVVSTDSNDVITDSPQTGDSFPWVYVATIMVSALGLVVVTVIFVKTKKRT